MEHLYYVTKGNNLYENMINSILNMIPNDNHGALYGRDLVLNVETVCPLNPDLHLKLKQKHVSAHLDKPGCAGLCASASLCPTVAPGSVLELLSRALTPPTTPPTCCVFPRMLSSSVYDVKTQTVE